MLVKHVKEDINKLAWYGKTIDKMMNEAWFADVDYESANILAQLSEDLPAIAVNMAELLDNAIIAT